MNKDKYYFDDFTFERYKEFLLRAKENYDFVFFNNYSQCKKYIVLRHDVDYSVESALAMAEIENEINIKSTFLFYLRCSFYNMLEPGEIDKIKQIQSLGHNIGIHFDVNSYEIKNAIDLERALNFEKEIFSKFIDGNLDTFSFHNPTLIAGNEFDSEEYAGLINTYSKKWKSKKYCSDSNGYWRYERLFDLVLSNQYSEIQVLVHPGHWNKTIMSPKERVRKIIYSKAGIVWENYKNLIEKNGRELIDWE